MKREALLDCLDTARDCYRHAWARTSVDIAIQVQLNLDLIPTSQPIHASYLCFHLLIAPLRFSTIRS